MTKKLTTEQKGALKFFIQSQKSMRSKRGSFARQKIAEHDTSLASVGLFTGQVDAPDGSVPAAAWTDGVNVYYSSLFEKFSPEEQVGVEIHEEFHIFLRHPQRAAQLRQQHGDAFDAKLWNIATDAIINETLRAANSTYYKLPLKGLVLLVELLKESFKEDWTSEEAIKYWNAERLYFALLQDNPHKKNSNGKGKNNGNGGGNKGAKGGAKGAADRAKEYADGKDWTPDMAEPKEFDPSQEKQEANDWRGLLERARKAGTGSNSVLRNVGADLPESTVPWQHILRAQVSDAVLRASEEDWGVPARAFLSLHEQCEEEGLYMPYMPGVNANVPVMRIGVAVDTSGSISPEILNEFAGEMRRIMRLTRAELYVVVADDRIHGEWEIKADEQGEGIGDIVFKGEGGTDFSPALKRLDEKKVGCIVYLTDLCGPTQYKPRNVKKIIWAIPARFGDVPEPPFGQKIVME